MTSSCNIPTLRFSNNSNLLKTEKIRELSTVRSGSTPLRANKAYFKNGKYPWVKTTDLNNSKILKTEESVTALALTDTSVRLFPENSILVAMYGGFNQIGRTGLLTKAAATNQALSVLNVDEEKVKPLYILYYLNSRIARWKRFAASSRKDPNITSSDVGAFPITYCGLKEQQKIADFLTSVDTKISQLTEKHRLLKNYKKGVMQQIFSQKIRFKDDDGNDFPEWDTHELAMLSESGISNGVFNDPKKVGKGFRLINVKDMYKGDSIKYSELTLLDLEPKLFEKNKVKYGDIFFTRSSIVPIGIAFSNVNLSEKEDITFDGHLMKISPNKNLLILFFLHITSEVTLHVKH